MVDWNQDGRLDLLDARAAGFWKLYLNTPPEAGVPGCVAGSPVCWRYYEIDISVTRDLLRDRFAAAIPVGDDPQSYKGNGWLGGASQLPLSFSISGARQKRIHDSVKPGHTSVFGEFVSSGDYERVPGSGGIESEVRNPGEPFSTEYVSRSYELYSLRDFNGDGYLDLVAATSPVSIRRGITDTQTNESFFFRVEDADELTTPEIAQGCRQAIVNQANDIPELQLNSCQVKRKTESGVGVYAPSNDQIQEKGTAACKKAEGFALNRSMDKAAKQLGYIGHDRWKEEGTSFQYGRQKPLNPRTVPYLVVRNDIRKKLGRVVGMVARVEFPDGTVKYAIVGDVGPNHGGEASPALTDRFVSHGSVRGPFKIRVYKWDAFAKGRREPTAARISTRGGELEIRWQGYLNPIQ